MKQKIYITTGPESSGKSTLAQQLSSTLNTSLVNEAARTYLEEKNQQYSNPNYQYQQSDLYNIAKLQFKAESDIWHLNEKSIISDTDLLVLIIWSEEKYQSADPWIIQTFEAQLAKANRHYFLCHWDIPWQADPLRENPHDRERLFDIYLDKLKQYSLPYTIVKGKPETRINSALALTKT